MSTTPSFSIADGQAKVAPQCQGYHFDLAPVFTHCDSLRRNPDRAIMMCQHQVRTLAPGDLMLPRNEGFYLVVQTCTGVAADALANEINLALLRLFFGTESLNGISSLFRPMAFSELHEAGVTTALVGTGEVSTGGPKHAAGEPLANLLQRAVQDYAAPRFGLLPMLNLQTHAPSIYLCGAVGFRAGRTIFGPAVFKGCDTKEKPLLDRAMLEYALCLAREIVPTKFAAAICTSVSFETLAWSRGRQLYVEALRAANVADNPFLIIKIEEIPRGTTGARLADLVAMLRPFVKRVFVQLPECEAALVQSGYIGATGLCLTLPNEATPPTIVRLATQLSRAALVQQAVSCVDAMNGSHALPLLKAAGVRFAAPSPEDSKIHLGHFLPDSIPAASSRAA